MKQAHFKISGHVQGVFYRAHARDEARRLNLKGIIQNMPDGSVEATLQGSEADLKQFKQWAHLGSPSSKPENVEMTLAEAVETKEEFKTLTIR
ncbi:MAG: acylphosphatase [Candidatus Gracilibacteria bacterium]